VGSSGGESTRYWPYGAARSGSVASTAYRFTGQRQDVAGLYFYRSRWYDAGIGRFLQPDPLIPDPGDPQSLNRYTYVRNNPLKYVDSGGHFAFVPLLIAGGVGALATSALDLGKQLVVDQRTIQDVNWTEVGGAAVGGFVSGATLGLAPAGASVIGLGLLGAAGGVAGSQAQALTQAGLEDLLGKNPQGSVIAEARNLGLLDAKTMVLSGGAGAVMGGLGGKFAGLMRSKLALPESASTVRVSGEMPYIRWQLNLDQPGVWTARMEGRVINMSADTFERVVRAMAMGGYELLEKTLDEAMQQGAIWVVKENTQP